MFGSNFFPLYARSLMLPSLRNVLLTTALAAFVAVGVGCDSEAEEASAPDPDVVEVFSVEGGTDQFDYAVLEVRLRNGGDELLGSVQTTFELYRDGTLVGKTNSEGVGVLREGEERVFYPAVRTPSGELVRGEFPEITCYTYEVAVSYGSVVGQDGARKEYPGTCE